MDWQSVRKQLEVQVLNWTNERLNPSVASFSFLNRAMLHAEHGMLNKMYDCTDNASRASCRGSKISLFESIEAYVDEYLAFSDLVLGNFLFIFLHYFLFCSLVFVSFCVHHLVKFVKKRTVAVRPHRRLAAVLRGLAARQYLSFSQILK